MHQNDPILRSFFSISRDVNKVWRLHMNNFEWSKMQLQCNCRLPPKTCMHRIQCVLCSHCPYIAIWLQREHMRGFENFLEPSADSTIVLKINQTSPHRMQSLQLLTCLCNCTFLWNEEWMNCCFWCWATNAKLVLWCTTTTPQLHNHNHNHSYTTTLCSAIIAFASKYNYCTYKVKLKSHIHFLQRKSKRSREINNRKYESHSRLYDWSAEI